MPQMARTTVLFFLSLVAIGHVTARALPVPQFPGSGPGSSGGSVQDDANSMNIESDDSVVANNIDTGVQPANVNGGGVNWGGSNSPSVGNNGANNIMQLPDFEEEVQNPESNLRAAQEEGLYYPRNQINSMNMLIESSDTATEVDRASDRTADEEEYADAGFEPDEEALQEDVLRYTEGRQPFDVAPETFPQIQYPESSQPPVQNLEQAQEVIDQAGEAEAVTEAAQEQEQGGQIIEVEEPIIRRPPPLIDINAYPPLAPEDVVTEENEFDEEGNMRIMTQVPDLDLRYQQRVDREYETAEVERNRRLAREEIELARAKKNLASGRKFLPDSLLPEGADISPQYFFRNERGERVNEYGLLLDENGRPIPEENDPYANDREEVDLIEILEDEAVDSNGRPLTGGDTSPIFYEKLKPTKYKFETDLNRYLNKATYDIDDSIFGKDNTSARSNISKQSSLNFRKPMERNRNGRGRRQRNLADAEPRTRPGPRTYRNRQGGNAYDFLDQAYNNNAYGQQYINDLSAQEIEDSMTAQAALDEQRRRSRAGGSNNLQYTTTQDRPSNTMTNEELMHLFALQAEQDATNPRSAPPNTVQDAMFGVASAGGVPSQRRGANNNNYDIQFGLQPNQVFDPGLYGIASEAFQGNDQLSSINNLAGSMPSGANPFDFDLGFSNGGQGTQYNPNLAFYDESLNINEGFNQQELLPPQMVRTVTNTASNGDYATKNASTMSGAELIDFLTNLDIPVGVGDDLYPVEYLRELVSQLMGGDL
ncbi:hypothetical protein TWF481_001959 [Arthrobotrys musiformis]|uniref:Uncharacterized protein n=1 Tax=Arthrobotrys musiformis TaxID=47236 RepID=A0AAV9VUY9_9PEZI